MGLNAFIESFVRKHLDSYEESHVRCFLDLYFQEMKKVEPKEEGFGFQCKFSIRVMSQLQSLSLE